MIARNNVKPAVQTSEQRALHRGLRIRPSMEPWIAQDQTPSYVTSFILYPPRRANWGNLKATFLSQGYPSKDQCAGKSTRTPLLQIQGVSEFQRRIAGAYHCYPSISKHLRHLHHHTHVVIRSFFYMCRSRVSWSIWLKTYWQHSFRRGAYARRLDNTPLRKAIKTTRICWTFFSAVHSPTQPPNSVQAT